MPTEPPAAKEIFLAAVELTSPTARVAFLDQACAGEPTLRRRVELLLAAHDEPGVVGPALTSALDFPRPDDRANEPADAAPVPGRPGEGPGSRVGPYKLLQQIGEGGMGVVYMAEQERPGPPAGRPQGHQAGDGLAAGRRPVRGRAPGAGADGPPEHRQGARRRHHRRRPAVLRDGAGQRRADHRATATRTSCRLASGWNCSCRSARRSSTPTRRGSSTATSSRPTSWSPCTTASRCRR